MPWFYVDDKLTMHPKIMVAGNEAMGLWVRAGSWSAAHLTDGLVPNQIVKALHSERAADHLVKAGLWHCEPGGWSFHDWSSWQATRAEVDERRAHAREAGAKGGRAKARSRIQRTREDVADA